VHACAPALGTASGVVHAAFQHVPDWLYRFAMPALELPIPARPSEVGQARRAVRSELVRFGLDREHADVAQLVVSELVMNAVLHGREPIMLRVSVDREVTVVEVRDDGDVFTPVHLGAESGRGLALVQALALDWGTVAAEGGGKTVWASISHAPRDATPDPSLGRRSSDQASN
jgi:anti-sigma regulatory factor (Ser/Thr protein kinase)